LEEAKKGKRKVFFVDAAHFVMGAYLICLWCLSRVFVKTSSGRQRYNVLGAIDVFSQDLVTVTNDKYINSDSICELLRKIFNSYNYLGIPITLVLDNAKYQRCQKVFDYAHEMGVELLFLPTYSPNLNLIERLWKFVKKKCLYAKHYDNFKDFKENIDKCLAGVSNEHKAEISSLITTNFQLFDEIKKEETNSRGTAA
jgi:transposase